MDVTVIFLLAVYIYKMTGLLKNRCVQLFYFALCYLSNCYKPVTLFMNHHSPNIYWVLTTCQTIMLGAEDTVINKTDIILVLRNFTDD